MIKANFAGIVLPRPSGFIAPFYGLSTRATNIPLAEMMALPRLEGDQFTLTAGVNQYQYFMLPKSVGEVTFIDKDTGFEGGWDGANDDPYNVYGPVVVPYNIAGVLTDFYVYRTDMANLGKCNWQVRYAFPI